MTDRHGHARRGHYTRAYKAWRRMRERCQNPNHHSWEYYGGRGIMVCPRWGVFENFLADMGDPEPGMTIDRIDVNGNYEPSNCRWIDIKDQQNNKRSTIRLEVGGEVRSLKDWCRETNVNYATAYSRTLRGVAPDAVVSPVPTDGGAPGAAGVPRPYLSGERNGGTALTAEQVLWIRRHPEVPARQAAGMFGITRQSVYLIRKGLRWIHLTEAP